MSKGNNWTMVGKTVLYFSQSYGNDGREYPLQPRAAMIVGYQGADRYTVTVFNDSNRNFSKPPVETHRGVKLCKPDETGTEHHWIVEPEAMPKSGDWTLPPTHITKPAENKAKTTATASA